MVIRAANSFMDRTVTGRYFGTGNGSRTVFNLTAGKTADRALLHPVLYLQDWQGGTLLTPTQIYSTSRTNMCPQSQTFNTGWQFGGAGGSASPNTTTAPDGTVTADTITMTGSIIYCYYDAISISGATAGRVYTFSLWVKAISAGTNIGLRIAEKGGATGTEFGDSSYTPISTTSWTRVSFSYTILRNDRTQLQVVFRNDNGAIMTTYAWGAQLELATQASRYIPTTTAAASVTDYSITPKGDVTFAPAPANGAVLTWTGNMGPAR